jgi:hypothetical protein
MRPVKLSISGAYWDSQIYSGELLLFDADGDIHRIDWRSVIDDIAAQTPTVQTAIRVAFSDSDLFYNPKVRRILCDPHIERPIKLQLDSLAKIKMDVSRETSSAHWRTERSPFDFLPTDTDVYYNHVLAGGNEGLYSTPRSGVGAGRPFGKRTTKHHDASILQVRASDRFTAVAVAAGADGLFEFAFRKDEADVLDNERRLAQRPCSSCDWAFQSVIGWTVGNAFFASFYQDKDSKTRRTSRTFDRIVDATEMFELSSHEQSQPAFTWGCREKIYRLVSGEIEVANYLPMPPREQKKASEGGARKLFDRQGSVKINFDAMAVISTGTAPFGTVLELDDRLVVLRSDGGVEEFEGEPVHWRVFPRSEHYSNQLHIIYDDRLEIVSFVHDYYVDQTSKLAGFKRGSNDYIAGLEEQEII